MPHSHNQERGGWLSDSDRHHATARKFFDLLKNETSCHLTETGPRRSDGVSGLAPGRMTVYHCFELKHENPAFILEQGVAFDPKLGRLLATQDRLPFGSKLIRAMAKTVLEKQ